MDDSEAKRHLFEAYMIGHDATAAAIEKEHPNAELCVPKEEARACLVDARAAKRSLMWCIYTGDPFLTRVVLDTTGANVFEVSETPCADEIEPCTPRVLAERMLDGTHRCRRRSFCSAPTRRQSLGADMSFARRRSRVLDVVDEEERIRKLGRIMSS